MTPRLAPKNSDTSPAAVRPQSRLLRHAYRAVGFVLLGCGFIGLWLPLLPTTIFLIGAVACFARSSPVLKRYLLRHRQFGPPLRDWFDEGAISKNGKAAALFGMGIGLAIIVLTIDSLPLIGAASAIMLGSGWFVISRPAPKREREIEE